MFIYVYIYIYVYMYMCIYIIYICIYILPHHYVSIPILPSSHLPSVTSQTSTPLEAPARLAAAAKVPTSSYIRSCSPRIGG